MQELQLLVLMSIAQNEIAASTIDGMWNAFCRPSRHTTSRVLRLTGSGTPSHSVVEVHLGRRS
jgi:hypothetical protein